MSSDAKVTLTWADGDHVFRLPIKQLEELQDKTKCGPAELLRRMFDGTWRVADLRETLRLGLIGGGMEPIDAIILVRRYVDERPLMESVHPAQAVLGAALFGVEGDQVGQGKAETENAATTAPDGSGSPSSTEQGPSSAGRRSKPASAASGNSRPRSTVTTEPTAQASRRPT